MQVLCLQSFRLRAMEDELKVAEKRITLDVRVCWSLYHRWQRCRLHCFLLVDSPEPATRLLQGPQPGRWETEINRVRIGLNSVILCRSPKCTPALSTACGGGKSGVHSALIEQKFWSA